MRWVGRSSSTEDWKTGCRKPRTSPGLSVQPVWLASRRWTTRSWVVGFQSHSFWCLRWRTMRSWVVGFQSHSFVPALGGRCGNGSSVSSPTVLGACLGGRCGGGSSVSSPTVLGACLGGRCGRGSSVSSLTVWGQPILRGRKIGRKASPLRPCRGARGAIGTACGAQSQCQREGERVPEHRWCQDRRRRSGGARPRWLRPRRCRQIGRECLHGKLLQESGET